MPLLKEKTCKPCEGTEPPLTLQQAQEFLNQVDNWELDFGVTGFGVSSINKIKKQFSFANFIKAIEFVNKISELAEKEGHHPDINISYNRVLITTYTHAISGLSENDFVLAAKIDEVKKDLY